MGLLRRTRNLVTSPVEQALYGPVTSDADYPGRIVSDEAATDLISRTLRADGPRLIARPGIVEARVCSYWLRWREHGVLRWPWLRADKDAMRNNTGFFPIDGASLDRFAREYLDAVATADVLAVYPTMTRAAPHVVERYCPSAAVIHGAALNPLQPNPWSAALEGQRVLVVHPFAKTIELQYRERRSQLFDDPRMLPEFDLQVLPAVQSIAGNDVDFASWFSALDHMCQQMDRLDYDVALVGAGAYGLRLAAHAKASGRKGIHVGGATQLLFGIIGRRWEVEFDDVDRVSNEWWVRPAAEETPPNHDRVEHGCYW